MSVPMTRRHHDILALALLRAKPERGKYEIPTYMALYREWIRCITQIIQTLEQDSQGFDKRRFLGRFFDETDFNLRELFK